MLYFVLKNRFGCLFSKLRYPPSIVGNIVVACCILQNMAILDDEPDPQADAQPLVIAGRGVGRGALGV